MSETRPITLVLAEDHDLTRIGLKAALKRAGLQIVGETATDMEGLKLLQFLQPDVAIVDIGLPDIDGIELLQKFQQSQTPPPATRILMLTIHDSEQAVLAAFAAGADSYCTKEVDAADLIQAIPETEVGNAWIDPAIATIVLRQVKSAANDALAKAQNTVEDDRTQVAVRALRSGLIR